MIEIFELSGENDSETLKSSINKSKPSRVVAVGGDGTIKMVGELLLNSDIPLSIVPAGSANGMAKELEIPTDIKESYNIITNGVEKRIDIIKINSEICIHLSDIGLNAMLIRHFEKYKKRGMWSYFRGAVKVLWNKTLMKVAITANNQTIQRKAYMIVLANASKYGTGAVINPEGDLSDGYFELVIVRKLSLAQVILKMVIKHKSFKEDRVEIIKTNNAKISSKRKIPLQVDGEYRGKVNAVDAWIGAGQLLVIVPQSK